jgi:selenide,water dikinase
MKRGLASPATIERAIAVMERLNGAAAALLPGFDVGAVTDVSGFGLLGHLREMSRGSAVDMRVDASKVPVLEEAWALAAAGSVPGGSRDNETIVGDVVSWGEGLSELARDVLCDAQTSGGLLIAVAPGQAASLVAALRAGDCPEAEIIGDCLGRGSGRIEVGSGAR